LNIQQSEELLTRANTEEEVASDTAKEVQDLKQIIEQKSESLTGMTLDEVSINITCIGLHGKTKDMH
jgi:hypothetical protein